jgi:hypothetical protein
VESYVLCLCPETVFRVVAYGSRHVRDVQTWMIAYRGLVSVVFFIYQLTFFVMQLYVEVF